MFDQADDPYLRERKGDVGDVVGRLCMNLRSAEGPAGLFRDVEGPVVLVADELTPSIVAQLDWQRLAALVTDAGSWTYHTAILARSIHVPAVAGLRQASSVIPPGAMLAVDGSSGEVLIEPAPDVVADLEARSNQRRVPSRMCPLASPCANCSRERPAHDAAAVRAALGVGLALPLDGGSVPPSVPSTVVDVAGPTPVILCRGLCCSAVGDDGIATALARPATDTSLTV